MATKRSKSEAATLERYRVSLDNAEAHNEIKTALDELGMDSDEIKKGKNLFNTTRKAYDDNKLEDNETSEAYKAYSDKKERLAEIYNMHRKKAKVIFRKDPVTLEKLDIDGSIPESHIKWIEMVKKFYSVVLADSDIQSKLTRLKISVNDLKNAQKLINEVETTRSAYLKEKGESQEATQIKDKAFALLDDWMSEFYAIARIGLEDKPQLLEVLGIIVRN
ncbi:MAG: hypothetical protein JXB49_27195 [Bacteroidales bacterium]|nr:hypothetical protein [Bacteroidales bacterium]